MKCADVAGEMMDLLYGELDERRRREVLAHLEGCAGCRAERDSFTATLGFARQALRGPLDEAPPARVRAAALAAAAAEGAAGPVGDRAASPAAGIGPRTGAGNQAESAGKQARRRDEERGRAVGLLALLRRPWALPTFAAVSLGAIFVLARDLFLGPARGPFGPEATPKVEEEGAPVAPGVAEARRAAPSTTREAPPEEVERGREAMMPAGRDDRAEKKAAFAEAPAPAKAKGSGRDTAARADRLSHRSAAAPEEPGARAAQRRGAPPSVASRGRAATETRGAAPEGAAEALGGDKAGDTPPTRGATADRDEAAIVGDERTGPSEEAPGRSEEPAADRPAAARTRFATAPAPARARSGQATPGPAEPWTAPADGARAARAPAAPVAASAGGTGAARAPAKSIGVAPRTPAAAAPGTTTAAPEAAKRAPAAPAKAPPSGRFAAPPPSSAAAEEVPPSRSASPPAPSPAAPAKATGPEDLTALLARAERAYDEARWEEAAVAYQRLLHVHPRAAAAERWRRRLAEVRARLARGAAPRPVVEP